ncbi:MAG: glycosyltransferase family 117 protein, partial [Janthinobacterium lividum]
MKYQKINNLFGWLAFLIAATTYILTLEPYGSFWDCGEFIACAYRLQVAHQPGAPLFTMIGKLFSLLAANRKQVAYCVNLSSALASAATIMFLFWTITAFAKKILVKRALEFDMATTILIIGAGLVGSLAYAWSDTFWFSAVEAEVYALSSLCTAIVFWAIMKWDAHADEPGADKWIVFIAYVMGLSIGIHLLNLLAIPA